MKPNRRWLPRIVALASLLIAAALFLRPSAFAAASAATDSSAFVAITGAVQDLDLENVRVLSVGDTVQVEYENRVYRDPLEALGAVVMAVAPVLKPDTRLELVALTRGIAVLNAAARVGDWVAFMNGTMNSADFRRALVTGDGSHVRHTGAGGGRRADPPWGKLDAAIRPLAQVELGIADDPFKYGFWLAPEFTMIPFRGALVTAQAVAQLRNDLDPFARPWRPGRTTISYAGWLPAGILGTASAGYFPSNRYGAAWAFGRFVDDGRLEVQLTGDYSGFLKFSRKNVVLYSGLEAWSGVLSATWRPRGLDVAATVSGGRFLYGDVGARVEVARRFHENEFSFFAVKSDEGSMAGLRFVVAMPVRHLGAPKRVRFVTTPDFPFEYREDTDPVGIQVNLYDDLERLRQRTNPVYLWNNLDQLKNAVHDGGGGNR